MAFQTEIDFVLPKGYVDQDGQLHREGVMRLATAADEILPLKDPRVKQNPAYLTVIVLARVITRLGSLNEVNTRVVEGLFATDLHYLQQQYEQINSLDDEMEDAGDAPVSANNVYQGGFAALGEG